MRRIPRHKKWFAAALVCALLLGAECIAAGAGDLLLLPRVHGFVTPVLGLLLVLLLGMTLRYYCAAKQRISRPCLGLGAALTAGFALSLVGIVLAARTPVQQQAFHFPAGGSAVTVYARCLPEQVEFTVCDGTNPFLAKRLDQVTLSAGTESAWDISCDWESQDRVRLVFRSGKYAQVVEEELERVYRCADQEVYWLN